MAIKIIGVNTFVNDKRLSKIKNVEHILSKFSLPKIFLNDKTSRKQNNSEQVFVTRRFLRSKVFECAKIK